MHRVCCFLMLALVCTQATRAIQSAPPSAAGQGRVLYVRQTVGDDANAGLSPATAWRTLAMLEEAMRAGDTAYVGPGLYREMVTVAHSGTAERRITFIADTSGEHTTDPPGTVMITGANAVDEAIFVPGPAPRVYKAAGMDTLVMNAVEMDGPQYRYLRAFDARERIREGMLEIDVVARRPSTLFHDREAGVVYIHTSDGELPGTHEIELIRLNYGFVAYEKHFVTVIGFTFRHMGTAGINFEKDSSHGIALDNVSYGSWQGIRVCNSGDALIADNVVFRNGNSGIYFLQASTQGYAIGNVAYQNAKGVRWSSESAQGLALDNVTFSNREIGISIENADNVRIVGNTLADNATSQLRMKDSHYASQGNCFDSGGEEQLVAFVDHHERYGTLGEFQRAAGQDTSSREGCGRLPPMIDVRRLHAKTLAYAERARKKLTKRSDSSGSGR